MPRLLRGSMDMLSHNVLLTVVENLVIKPKCNVTDIMNKRLFMNENASCSIVYTGQRWKDLNLELFAPCLQTSQCVLVI